MGALCAGCCGSGMCWVCLGTGKLEVDPGVRTACHKCDGTAQCHVCGGEAEWQVSLAGQRTRSA